MIKLLAAALLLSSVPCRAAESCSPDAQRVSSAAPAVPASRLAEPACHATGSVAFYYFGLEAQPEIDFVKTVESGGEASLKARLLELRWYDEKDGLRHAWADGELADKLGWFTDERGERGGPWPISYAAPINGLY